MSSATARRINSTLLVTAATCAIALAALGPDARAGQYTVASCDSAAAFGHNTTAWVPFGNAGTAYEACPTFGGLTAGVSNRLTQGTYGGFSHSGHAFTAPPGATITKIRWAGRIARDNCRWAVYFRALPSGALVLGMPNGQFCETLGFDNRGFPLEQIVPGGTTRLEQLVICGASECSSPAVFHSHVLEVTIDDPQPPSISLGGPLASGQWVSGTAGRPSHVDVRATDNAGVQRIETSLGASNPSQSYGCNWSHSQPCLDQATMTSAPGVGGLPDGRHTLWVSATDAAANVTSRFS